MTRASEFQQVGEDLIFWQEYSPEVKVELSSCAVRAAHGWVYIDPIALEPDVWSELRDLAPPEVIVLTNSNHARAADWFRQQCCIPVAADPRGAEDLEVSIDEEIQPEMLFAGDLQSVPIDGAVSGEIAILSPGGRLHLGDALINLPSHGFTFLPDKYCTNPTQMRRTLRKLLDLDFHTATFAHGLPLMNQPKSALSRLFV